MLALAFDGRTGASGDMLLGALLAAGADPDALSPVTDALPVDYRIETVQKRGVTATAVTVETDGERAESHDAHRSYADVIDLLDAMALPSAAATNAAAVFERLAGAEAAVHGTGIRDTHFHEVGADDALADVAGVCALLDDLGPERVVTTPVALGGGETTFSHGTYPVPAPATVELLESADFETYGGPVEEELLTPTGAALLAELADGVPSLPPMRTHKSGYGAGTLDLSERPNVLRAALGETDGELRRDDITVLETNLDDAAPEVVGSLQETLLAAGARDVSVVPLTMKKSRPGHLVRVVCKPADAQSLARKLAVETGTLGVRETGASHRWIATRKFETATLDIDEENYEIPVKVASDEDGVVYDVSAEYDDALAVAEETGVPVREVCRRAEERVR